MRTKLLRLAIAGLAAGALAAEPDLATDAMKQLRADYLAQKAPIAAARADALKKLLEENAAKAQEMLAKSRVSGNITAQATANTALKLFADARAAFEKDGATPPVTSTRRDLAEMLDLYKLSAQVVDDRQTTALKALDRAFAARLGEILAAQQSPEPDEDKRRDLLARLLALASAAAPGPATNAVAGATNAPAAEPPTVIATTGTAGNWVPFLRADIVVRDALEIVSVPVASVREKRTLDGEGANGQPWKATLTPLQELVVGGAEPAFRLQSVPPHKPASVLTWPSAANNWTLELRTKTPAVPSRHAVLIETDAATCRGLDGSAPAAPGAAAAPGRAAAPLVWVRFDSYPTGAFVAVNGAVLGTSRAPYLTPFNYQLPAQPANIRFSRRGCTDVALEQKPVASNAVIRVVLAEKPGFVERTVTVAANGPEWSSCGVRAAKSAKVQIAAQGSWSCGSGGETVDAEGYPNDNRFFEYYLDPSKGPRLVQNANYGQLLARVLPDGEPVAVGRQGTLTAPAAGDIALTINEPAKARHDNRGKLSVTVTVLP